MAYLSQSLYKTLFVVALSCVLNHAANADAYLDMLEGEAADVKLDQSGQIQVQEQTNRSTDGITKTNWKWEGDLEGNVLPSGLVQDEFATLLKDNFYGTFVFYRKLNSVDQSTVFYHYSQSTSASLDSIRDDILSHLKQ